MVLTGEKQDGTNFLGGLFSLEHEIQAEYAQLAPANYDIPAEQLAVS